MKIVRRRVNKELSTVLEIPGLSMTSTVYILDSNTYDGIVFIVPILADSGFFLDCYYQSGVKPTVYGVFQDLKFKISEGSSQNW